MDFRSLMSSNMFSNTELHAFRTNLCALNLTWSSLTKVTSDDSPEWNKLPKTPLMWLLYECQFRVNFSTAMFGQICKSILHLKVFSTWYQIENLGQNKSQGQKPTRWKYPNIFYVFFSYPCSCPCAFWIFKDCWRPWKTFRPLKTFISYISVCHLSPLLQFNNNKFNNICRSCSCHVNRR